MTKVLRGFAVLPVDPDLAPYTQDGQFKTCYEYSLREREVFFGLPCVLALMYIYLLSTPLQ